MEIKPKHSYLIRDNKELLMFIKELERIGEFSQNSYLKGVEHRFNHYFVRLSVDECWSIVHGNYPKEEPTDTKSLTRYQKLHASHPYSMYQCTLWGKQTIKYNKDKLCKN